MTFSKANSVGWVDKEIVTAEQLNHIDTNQSRAIDGYAGGTYSPSAAIILENSELYINSSTIELDNTDITVTDGDIILATGYGGVLKAGVDCVEFSIGAYPNVSARSINQAVPLCPSYISDFIGSSSSLNNGNDFTCDLWLQQNHITDTPQVNIPWQPIPYHGTILSMGMSLNGGITTHTDLPTIMPTLELWSLDSEGNKTLEAEATDASANIATYNNQHWATVQDLSIAITGTDYKHYSFIIRGESGTNSQLYTRFYTIRTRIQVTQILP